MAAAFGVDLQSRTWLIFKLSYYYYYYYYYLGCTNFWHTLCILRHCVICIQIRGLYDDVKVSTLYDVLHDPVYRKTWDPSILEGEEICRIDASNDIGYYASAYVNERMVVHGTLKPGFHYPS